MVQVKNILRGKQKHINEQKLKQTVAIRLDEEDFPENFVLRLYPINERSPNLQVSEDVIPREYVASRPGEKTVYVRFRLGDLAFSQTYRSEIWKGDTQLVVHKISTPPPNDSDQTILFAALGDQENLSQDNFLNPLVRLMDGDNMKHTKLLYEHIGQFGTPGALATDIDRGYDLFVHLGDTMHGEYIVELLNIFRSGEKVFSFNVDTLAAFRQHLIKDFGEAVGLHLADTVITNLIDDHDLGGNGRANVKTASEAEVQKAVEQAFHEFLLHPQFLKDDKKGPYYEWRVGNLALFYLHTRYTQEPDAPSAFLLGNEQWAWLEAAVANSDAKVKAIACPLPLVMGKKPSEDFRGELGEWERFVRFCKDHGISIILTADSHNCSVTELLVRENEEDEPWKIMQYLIGTGGGKSQSISKKERKVLDKTQGPLLPKGVNPELYRGSKVLFYFSPGEEKAYIAPPGEKPRWTAKKEWGKGVHAYGGFEVSPIEQRVKFTLFGCSKKNVTPRLVIDSPLGVSSP